MRLHFCVERIQLSAQGTRKKKEKRIDKRKLKSYLRALCRTVIGFVHFCAHIQRSYRYYWCLFVFSSLFCFA